MNLIEVEYEPLNTISSIEEAVMIEEPRIHEYGDVGNIHKKGLIEFGDVEEGFAEADLVREDIVLLRRQHASADGTTCGRRPLRR